MPPEQTPKKPTATTGPFALLCGLLGVGGTSASKTGRGCGASKTGRRLILSALATTLGALAFTSAPALAAGGGHVFSNSFGETCVVAAGEPCEGKFNDPTGIAVNNETGNVYVVDKGNNRVEYFSSSGEYKGQFNGAAAPTGALENPTWVAVDDSGSALDESKEDVYVTGEVEGGAHHVVYKFSSTGAYLGQITGTCEQAEEVPPSCKEFAEFESFDGVAVDPQGQLWVYQKNGQIDAFSDAASNAFLSSVPSPDSPTAAGFAVNSEDDLYVAHGEEAEAEVAIAKLNSKGQELEVGLGGLKGKTGVAVEAASNDVYIDSGNPENGAPEIQEFTPAGAEIETFGKEQLADKGGKGLAVSYANISRGDVYVVDAAEGKVDIFASPKVTAHVFGSSFGKGGSGAGEFADPTGVAVNDETGDAYVVDKGNNRVEELERESDGTYVFVRAWGWGVVAGGLGGFEICTTASLGCKAGEGGTGAGQLDAPEAIAVDNDKGSPSYGDVYVTNTAENVVDKFSATGEYKGQIAGTCEAENEVPPACEPSKTFIPFAPLVGVAVGADGVVWVAQRSRAGQTGEIDAFSNEEPNSFLSRREPQTGGSDLPHPGFAVDSADDLYVTLERAAGDLVAKLGSDGKALETSGAEDFCGQPLGLRTGVAVDLSSEDVLLDYGTSIGECSSSGSSLESFGTGHLTGGSGLAANATSGAVYVADSAANDVDIFDQDPLAQVAVGAGSALTPSSVTLEGEVTPEGRAVSSCDFEYGTTTAYGQTAACEPAASSLGEGTKAKPVTAKLKGLASGTTYHYRLVASSTIGTNRSADYEVKTLGPEISAEEFNFVEETDATLHATIDPNGSATSYHFEYDTSPYAEGEGPHGTDLPTPSASVGAGTSPVPVSLKAQGLEPGTTYYFRAVAESALQGAPHLFDGESKTFTTSPAPSATVCPNEQLRAEQPFGLTLPDCRAYEMVSPEETGGQDATGSFEYLAANARAAVSGENPAITYASKGSFGEPKGAANTDQFVSRREPANDRWSTQAITPLWNPSGTENTSSFEATVFTPELEEGVAATNASLPGSGAPKSFGGAEFGLYVADFATGSYRYVGPSQGPPKPLGVSTDLSHVVFAGLGEKTVSEWVNGEVVPVNVTNEGTVIEAAVGSQHTNYLEHDVWHAVSADGARVYFTSPPKAVAAATSSGGAPGALYVRVNAEQPQSPLASPEVSGTGTVTKGLDEVTALAVATGTLNTDSGGNLPLGATLYPVSTTSGKFRVDQQVSGPGIAPDTTITQISTFGYGQPGEFLTLSNAITEEIGAGSQISSGGPEPFEVGQKVSGEGIPAGTTIAKAVPGKLTLSEPATTSATSEALHAGGGCTLPPGEEACTVEVSPAGASGVRYWGASADGEKVFYTKEGNLYQYSLPIGQTEGQTTALTAAGEVQGVVQISEDGAYVYFVADGVLAPGASQGSCLPRNELSEPQSPVGATCNLYVSHDGETKFIATLAAGDAPDWHGGNLTSPQESGPQINTAVVNPSGSRLAFLSERSLPTTNFPTGYDNKQTQHGECEGSIDFTIFGETGACQEVYLYDAGSGGAGSLVCASCNPTGARPVGPSGFGRRTPEFALYRPRNLLEDGTLFFDSSDALVPNAKDGRQNVYEYEEGAIHAISNVAGGGESFFLDASATGEDVFFGSANKLLTQDTGNNVVVWDARKDGGFPVTPAAPSCDNADACKPPESPQPAVFGLPASATFSGPGNPPPPAVVKPAVKPKTLTRAQKLAAALKVCKRDKKKAKHVACEKQAKKKYGSKTKAKKATTNRRASR